MKKILSLSTAALLFTGAAFAHEGKSCCNKEGSKKECCKKVAKDCCKKDSKAASVKKAA